MLDCCYNRINLHEKDCDIVAHMACSNLMIAGGNQLLAAYSTACMRELFTYLVGDEYGSMYIIFIMHKYT